MSAEAQNHLAAMVRALKIGLAGPLDKRPKLSPEAMGCLRDGDWEGVAVSYLWDVIEDRRVAIGREALRHLCDWTETPDVNRTRLVQDLIVRFNAVAERRLAEELWRQRPLNRADKRAMKRRA